VTCGTSIQNRIVGCYLSTDTSNVFTGNFPYPEAYCNPSTRPVSSQPCTGINGATCTINVSNNWYTSNTGICSANCGGGLSDVNVICRSGTFGNVPVPDASCTNSGPKPATQIPCNTQACPANYCLATRNDILSCWEIDYPKKSSAGQEAAVCAWSSYLTTSVNSVYAWFTGPWQSCVSSTHTQQRSVSCRVNNANTQIGVNTAQSFIVANSFCSNTPGLQQPLASQSC